MTDSSTTLSARGQIYVSLAAAQQYASARRLQPEEARRQLTELLLDAKPRDDGSYRARSRSTQIDITARVAVEGRLLVITTINVRDYL